MEFPLDFAACEKIGGHCWNSSQIVLMSNPPQYPEHCRHCGATRKGTPQESMSYTDPVPAPRLPADRT